MNVNHGVFGPLFIDEAGYFDFRCADGENVNPHFIEGLEKFAGDFRVGHDAGADDGKLGHALIKLNLLGADFKGKFLRGKPEGKGLLIYKDKKKEVKYIKGKFVGNLNETFKDLTSSFSKFND